MALTDPYLIFSSIVWFLVTFVTFFNFVISNKNFLGILKNLKFRKKKFIKSLVLINELDNINFLFILIYLIFLKWVQKWGRVLSELIKKVYINKKYMYILIVMLPLISACFAGLFGKKLGFKGSSVFSTTCLSLVLVMSCAVFYEVSVNSCCVYIKVMTWIDSGVLNINPQFMIDSLTIIINGGGGGRIDMGQKLRISPKEVGERLFGAQQDLILFKSLSAKEGADKLLEHQLSVFSSLIACYNFKLLSKGCKQVSLKNLTPFPEWTWAKLPDLAQNFFEISKENLTYYALQISNLLIYGFSFMLEDNDEIDSVIENLDKAKVIINELSNKEKNQKPFFAIMSRLTEELLNMADLIRAHGRTIPAGSKNQTTGFNKNYYYAVSDIAVCHAAMLVQFTNRKQIERINAYPIMQSKEQFLKRIKQCVKYSYI
jgi:hypothetical protein